MQDGAAAVMGLRAGAGHPGARRQATSAAAPEGTVPVMRGDARPAPVVGGSPARGCRGRDRAGGRRIGAARHGLCPARRGAGRPGRDRAGLAAPPPRPGRPDAAGSHVRVRPSRRRHRDPRGPRSRPAGPAGSPLGDALALVIACALAAIRWHGRAEADLDALIGRFGLAAALAPAPGS